MSRSRRPDSLGRVTTADSTDDRYVGDHRLLTDIGENIDDLNEEFRPFRERFGVQIEKRD